MQLRYVILVFENLNATQDGVQLVFKRTTCLAVRSGVTVHDWGVRVDNCIDITSGSCGN